jgi:uncharacterized protein YecE (DUF72 family)
VTFPQRGGPRTPDPDRPAASAGRLYVGTSGFAYPAWSPRFYPADLRGSGYLSFYASAFRACELNNTFYQQPSAAKVDAWLAATPSSFRFAVKAQRGGSMRALLRSPEESVPWLTEPIARFGDRLGTVLFRVPADVPRDDARLAALLALWPAGLPLTMEFQDPSWQVDETFDALRGAGAAWCATDLDELERPPDIRVTGTFLYLRLRRTTYQQPDVVAWAERLAPFLDAGHDAFCFFRHDEDGRATELAKALDAAVAASRATDRAAAGSRAQVEDDVRV